MILSVYLQHTVLGRGLITKPSCKLFLQLPEARNFTENLRVLVYMKITFLLSIEEKINLF